ncbi:hypothetical protein BMI79_09290 [Serratia oryzae]|uniref:Uncharacterized protein n=1 Tax=Serratia oryzae TaxID=2034155 RepID=A0A1S8CK11_9GAMM|nr:hypothetical protein BMI79_09290 [Serratia oryzae]
METRLSEVLVFKLFWAEATTGTVATKPIIIALDIIKHGRSHYFPAGKVLAVDTFHFQRVKEAFHACTVVTTASGAHTVTQSLWRFSKAS